MVFGVEKGNPGNRQAALSPGILLPNVSDNLRFFVVPAAVFLLLFPLLIRQTTSNFSRLSWLKKIDAYGAAAAPRAASGRSAWRRHRDGRRRGQRQRLGGGDFPRLELARRR